MNKLQEILIAAALLVSAIWIVARHGLLLSDLRYIAQGNLLMVREFLHHPIAGSLGFLITAIMVELLQFAFDSERGEIRWDRKPDPVQTGRNGAWWQVLGVSEHASMNEIKRAYRKLAKESHPDTPGGDAEKFRRVAEAYLEAQRMRGF